MCSKAGVRSAGLNTGLCIKEWRSVHNFSYCWCKKCRATQRAMNKNSIMCCMACVGSEVLVFAML